MMDFRKAKRFNRPPDVVRRTGFPGVHLLYQAVLLRFPVQRQESLNRLAVFKAADVNGPEPAGLKISVNLFCFEGNVAVGGVGQFRFKNRIGTIRPVKTFDQFPEHFDSARQVDLRCAEVHGQPCDMVPLCLRKRAFPAEEDTFLSIAEGFQGRPEPLLHPRESVQRHGRIWQVPFQLFSQPCPPAAFCRVVVQVALGNRQQFACIFFPQRVAEQILHLLFQQESVSVVPEHRISRPLIKAHRRCICLLHMQENRPAADPLRVRFRGTDQR